MIIEAGGSKNTCGSPTASRASFTLRGDVSWSFVLAGCTAPPRSAAGSATEDISAKLSRLRD